MIYGTPTIVTNGLVLNLDALNSKSIPLDPTVNQVLWSQNFSQSVWSKSTYDTLTTGSSAPDGTPTATLVDETNAYLNPAVFAQSNFRANGTTITYSIYTKKGTATSRNFLLRNTTTSTNFTFLSFQYSISSSAAGWTVQDVGDGWFRLAYTQTTGITPGNILAVYAGRTNAAESGSTATWYLWGAQVESTSYATPYIQSTSTLGGRNTWRDLSGNNNVATLTTASISSSIPQYSYLNERVLNFDGTGSYAIVNSNILQDSGGTINMWVYPTSTTGYIFAAVGTNSDRFYINRGSNSFSFSRGNPIVQHSKLSVPSGFWYNITLTWDSSSFNSYVNGVYNLTSTYAASGSTSLFTIGGYTSPLGSQAFAGKIATTQIYNRALSQQEITQNYNAYKSRYGLS